MGKSMFKKLIITMICGFAINNTAIIAGDCGIISHHNQHCVIQQPTINTIITPVKKTVVVEQHKVEFDANYFLGINGYYDVVNNLRQNEQLADRNIIERQQDQQDKLIGVLESISRNQETALKQQELILQTISAVANGKQLPKFATPPIEQPGIPQDQKPEQKPKPQPEQPSTPNNGLDQKVFSIFKKNCSDCHGYNKADAGLQLVGKEENGEEWLADLTLPERTLVHYRTAGIGLKAHGDKLMPLNGTPLQDSDIETLRQWVVAKAKVDMKSLSSINKQ